MAQGDEDPPPRVLVAGADDPLAEALCSRLVDARRIVRLTHEEPLDWVEEGGPWVAAVAWPARLVRLLGAHILETTGIQIEWWQRAIVQHRQTGSAGAGSRGLAGAKLRAVEGRDHEAPVAAQRPSELEQHMESSEELDRLTATLASENVKKMRATLAEYQDTEGISPPSAKVFGLLSSISVRVRELDEQIERQVQRRQQRRRPKLSSAPLLPEELGKRARLQTWFSFDAHANARRQGLDGPRGTQCWMVDEFTREWTELADRRDMQVVLAMNIN